MSLLPADVFLDGVLLRREAIALGVSDKHLHRLVREGAFARIRQGVYAVATHWLAASPEARQQMLTAAVVRLYGPSTLISHDSAVAGHGGPTWRLDLHHVQISYEGANGRIQARVVHHDGARRSDDVPRLAGGWLRSPTQATIETITRTGSVEVGVCIASYFLHQEMTTPAALREAHARSSDHRGALIVRTALALADARLESVGESRTWYLLRRAGLPEVVPQFVVLDETGRFVARVDFAIPELRVLVEFDGREKYERYRRAGESIADTVVRERRREIRIMEATGWQVVRITWADLAYPERIVQRVVAAAQLVRA